MGGNEEDEDEFCDLDGELAGLVICPRAGRVDTPYGPYKPHRPDYELQGAE